MKLIKLVLSAVLAAVALTSVGTSPAGAAGETPISLAEIVKSAEAQVKAGAAFADSAWFYVRSYGRGGYCLDNFASGGGANNSKVGLWSCNNGVSERWRLRIWNDGMFYKYNLVNEASGRCLDYPASAGNNIGWQINVYDCFNGASAGQNFRLNPFSIDGVPTYTFQFQATTEVVALDAFSSQWNGNGSPVGLWTYVSPGNTLQHWYFTV
jgi:hypothetical protein